MSVHKFDVGDLVRFAGSGRDPLRANGVFEVLRQLPPEVGDPQYRLKGEGEPYERMARESQLARVS
jgi:hypothetical protein